MRLNYFKECKTVDQAKELYRTLAKKHHPDMGGSAEAFIKLKEEYDYVIKYGIEPSTTNADWMKDFFTTFADMADVEVKFNTERSTRRSRDKMPFGNYASGFGGFSNQERDAAAFKAAEQQRISNYFDVKANSDPNYGIIEGTIAEGAQKNQDNKWLLFEVYKLDDLDIDHFKYIQWKLNLRKGWAIEAYEQYLKSNQIKWK